MEIVPRCSYDRTMLRSDGGPNRSFFFYLFSNMAMAIEFLKEIGLLRTVVSVVWVTRIKPWTTAFISSILTPGHTPIPSRARGVESRNRYVSESLSKLPFFIYRVPLWSFQGYCFKIAFLIYHVPYFLSIDCNVFSLHSCIHYNLHGLWMFHYLHPQIPPRICQSAQFCCDSYFWVGIPTVVIVTAIRNLCPRSKKALKSRTEEGEYGQGNRDRKQRETLLN
jgi:hypothetical protein